MMWTEDVQQKEKAEETATAPAESVDVVDTEEPVTEEKPEVEKPKEETNSGTTQQEEQKQQETKQPPAEPKQEEKQAVEQGTSDLAAETTYTVQSGDTLYGIALKFYKSKDGVDIIKQANNLTSTSLRVGQVLQIPPVEAQ